MNHGAIAAQLTVQLLVILAACVLMGRLVRFIGQPPVIGEMLAGVLLGPSLLGLLAPDLHALIFPTEGASTTILYSLSQLGLVLYMFIVGLEFDLGQFRRHASAALKVSSAGFFTPLLLGGVLAYLLLTTNPGRYFDRSANLLHAAIFLGAAIATTAFPMLARIISERGIAGTRFGTIALAAGAITDAASWILLAIVVAFFNDDPRVAGLAVLGGLLYAVALLTVGRPVLASVVARATRDRDGSGPLIGHSTLMLVLALILAASWYTNAVGIHSIFGGFLLGVVMPKGEFADELTARMGPVIKGLLLPLFFTFSGLNTEIGLLNSPSVWALTGLAVALSVLGKGVACHVAARRGGLPRYEALAVGGLMNSRGLIELILLNIGLQAGLITPTLFTMLVLMAVVTTLMAAPTFDLAARRGHLCRPAADESQHLPRPLPPTPAADMRA